MVSAQEKAQEESTQNLRLEIHRFLQDRMAGVYSVEQNLGQLTIGLEQECFLVDQNHKPIESDLSQEFMTRLSGQRGWTAFESFNFDEMGPLIWRISKKDDQGRVTTVRYRHHPHQIEIITPQFKDLHDFKDSFAPVFELLETIATDLGVKLWNQPMLNIPSFSTAVTSSIPYWADMMKFRTKLYLKRGDAIDSEAVNHPAIISSTKTVVGGVNWHKNPKIINSLYLIEPKILTLTSPRRSIYGTDLQEIVRKRWDKLIDPYKFSPLMGFPRLVEWNVETWVDALMRTPLMGPAVKTWSGMSLQELGELPFGSFSTFLAEMRELQMIYPSLSGTLTFQSDPSPVTLKNILSLMAFRLGLTSIACLGFTPKGTFIEAEKEWKKKITGIDALSAVEAPAYFAAANKGLQLREHAEERHLVIM